MEKPTYPSSDHTKISKHSTDTQKRVIWDCGSSLYDSFELKSFEKQLNSAIAARTNSMPHLSDRRLPNPTPRPNKKATSKFARSINRLLRAVFRPKNNTSSSSTDKMLSNNSGRGPLFDDGYFSQRYDHSSPVLSTISEIPEYEEFMMSPDHRFNLKRRAASDRFSTSRVASSIGISCV